MEILITGASGFVGQNLILSLEQSDLLIRTVQRSKLQLIKSEDISDSSVIVHLAGKAHDLKKNVDPSEYYYVNFELTKRLYDAFLKSNAKKFIFVSSVKAAADSVKDVLTEDVIPLPQTPYGKSKLMAEEYIKSQPLAQGKSYYILRPSMVHGPGNKGNLNLLYQVVKKGIPYPLAAFENKRTFLSVKNLCFIINELINQTEVPSGIYNIADDEALSTTEVVKILAQSMSKTPTLWRISKTLITTIAKFGNILKLPLNTERLNKLTDNYLVSNLKITQALNIKLPINAREGLIETANSLAIYNEKAKK